MSKVKEKLMESIDNMSEERINEMHKQANTFIRRVEASAYWTGILHTIIALGSLYIIANITGGL